MRHIVIRLIVGIVWLIAAVVACLHGSYAFAGVYAALGIALIVSGYAGWKKRR